MLLVVAKARGSVELGEFCHSSSFELGPRGPVAKPPLATPRSLSTTIIMAIQAVKAAASAVVQGKNPVAAAKSVPKVEIPKPDATASAAAPKTPADEAINFFKSTPSAGEEPLQVYELKLEDDGGPNKDRAVSISHCIS